MQETLDDLPAPLYRARDVREIDRRAIEQYHIPGLTLMTCAGEAAWRLLCARWPRARRLVVACGAGNNGGDGYVIARLAHAQGLEVRILQVAQVQAKANDALATQAACASAGISMQPFNSGALGAADVIVDAMLGTGLERAVEGSLLRAIEAINEARRDVLAVDIPSGLHADTGRIMGAAVRACATMSFIGLKAGLFTGAGRDHSGEVFFDDLGIPAAVYDGIEPAAMRVRRADVAGSLARRRAAAHKGDFGRVLIVGGNHGMPGACILAANAAYRAGAGLVIVATQPAHVAAVAAARPEALVYGIERAEDLAPLIARADVIAIGPGLGRDHWAKTLLTAVLDADRSLVVDADALNLLAADPVRRTDWILTPHPAEAARLLATDTADVQADRFAAIERLTANYGGTCVLKGSGTLIQRDDQRFLCDRGVPAMASAGMGDVLTGVIAALMAQGLPALAAARAGVWLHAVAGEAAARATPVSVLAGDLLAPIARHLAALQPDGSS